MHLWAPKSTMDTELATLNSSDAGQYDKILPYHANNSLKLDAGYLGHLNPSQSSALESFSAIFAPKPGSPSLFDKAFPDASGWQRTSVFLRFLRARKFSIPDAEKMLRANIEYRLTNDINALAKLETISEVFDNYDIDYSDVAKYYPHSTIGFDTQGRPVTYKLWGTFEVWNLKKMTSLDNLVKFHVWEQERLFEDMVRWSKVRGYHCETITAVIDIKGMRLRQITKDFLYLLKHMAAVDQNHYPERMGTTYIINCPSMFSMVWKGIVPWLDKNTAAKIKILASEKEWKPVLHESIGIDQLPPIYQGLNTAVNPVMAEFFGVDPSKIQSDLRSSDLRSGTFQAGDRSMYDIFDNSPPANLPEPIVLDNSSASGSDFHSARNADSIDLENPNPVTPTHRQMGYETPAPGGWRCCGRIPCFRPCYTKEGKSRLQGHLLTLPLRMLCFFTDICNILMMIIATAIIVSVSIFISSDVWNEYSGVVNVLIWIAVVTVTLGAVLLIVGFDGVLAVHHQNTHLLKFHYVTLFSLSSCLALISIVSLIYGSNIDDLLKSYVSSDSDGDSDSDIIDQFKDMHYAIAGITGAASLFAYIPGILGSTVRKRFQAIFDNASKQGITEVFYKSNIQKIRQLRVVLRCSNSMSFFFAFACIGFGLYGTRQAMEYQLNFSVYAPFLLFLLGIVLTFISAMAFWASSSVKPEVFTAYGYMTVPFLIGIIAFGVSSFFQAYTMSADRILDSVVEAETDTKETIAAKVKATLIVSGVLECMTAFFFVQNLLVTRKLFVNLVKSKRAVKWRREQIANEVGVSMKDQEELENLSRTELVMATASILCGFLYIFFDGSYMIFSDYVSQRDGWVTALWREMSHVDDRYIVNDPFVLSSVYFGALVLGPSNILYAWSLLTRKRFTHVLGIILSTSVLVTQLFYFSTVLVKGSLVFDKADIAIAFWFFVYAGFFRVVWPLFVVIYEAKRAVGLFFEHVDISQRLKQEEETIGLDAAQVLFGGSSDDLAKMAEKVERGEGGGGGGSPSPSQSDGGGGGGSSNGAERGLRMRMVPYKETSV
ncbi:hypothetical protein TrVE_jg6160 [Triparma verrucosa]|uniref:CRAL-TRIO domain-containing protein n=1 Tax=Triparma verrucosa TaxID=1606542 RepID=A0A9W7FN57_9STRA|nr:hypothetical protein TrVE_jg6160 [Triparma verrucosa]